MQKLTTEQLKEVYMKLPNDLKEAILSVDSTQVIEKVGKKYNLMIDKIGELADETGLVMLGLTPPREYIPNLSRRLGIDRESAKKIAEEINLQVFSKVRESLKKIHGIGAPQTESPLPRPPEFARAARVETPLSAAPIPSARIMGNRIIGREEILKEIEKTPEIKPETKEADKIPEIIKGVENPFEAKTKSDIFRIPPEEKKYSDTDPYREQL